MKLIEALRYKPGSSVAFVGSGGKSTAIFIAARDLTSQARKNPQNTSVVVTTSTHMGAWQAKQADKHVVVNGTVDIERLEIDLSWGVVLVSGLVDGEYLGGLAMEQLDNLQKLCKKHNLTLMIEADGSHRLPLKAPDVHEPAIPWFVDQVVVVVGLSGIGKPLTAERVHRAVRFSQLSGIPIGETISSDVVAKVLLHKDGGLKNIPDRARKAVLLNQADNAGLQSAANAIANQVVDQYDAAIIASLEKQQVTDDAGSIFSAEIHGVVEKIGGVILAAGESTRFGSPKQLLDWKGAPMIRQVAKSALQAGLFPVVVVTGAAGEEVRDSIKELPLRIVNNIEWLTGVSSSIRKGMEQLPTGVGGVTFLQSDQPQVTPILIRSLVEAHQYTLAPIIAPLADGKRGNPVLFDQNTFADLMSLEGDMGGRVLFQRYPLQYVTWHDARILMDVDTPEDYQHLINMYQEERGEE